MCSSNSSLDIQIHRYGFVTTSGEGEGDPVKPELDIGLVLDDQKELRLNLKDSNDQLQTAQLDSIKKDGNKSSALLRNGYQILLEKYEKHMFLAEE